MVFNDKTGSTAVTSFGHYAHVTSVQFLQMRLLSRTTVACPSLMKRDALRSMLVSNLKHVK